ncbi:hypothetical protein MSAN_01952400 [Mycena sanguinolenta]|uniref:MACPF domain-containing protein n=1 Tax=Mycena sanguinolenta TaxID=230812 RepID=A0A8H7CPP5_9AGAR|nr:hypothetical protein MSAN_01952400 [Mycena sanguinolenta]
MSDGEDSVITGSEDGHSIVSLPRGGPSERRTDHPNRHAAVTRTSLSNSGLISYRHPFRAIVLLLGASGHGKSTTINRLIGHNLLRIGRSEFGSTTKDIERVNIAVPGHRSSSPVTLSFDDTPGTDDTTNDDRATNSSLLRIYSTKHFTTSEGRKVYPNIILLVVAWASITLDAHNAPHFTSALGKSMNQLHLSGLVDHERPNVIVVVTKSLSDWSQFDDFKTAREKDAHWMEEAEKRREIIVDVQVRLFPRLRPWKVVFIENSDPSFTEDGIDPSVRKHKFPVLPNRELSHQNLFVAMRSLIAPVGGVPDITGLHALQVVTGADPLKTSSIPRPEILVHRSEAQQDMPSAPPSSSTPVPPDRTRELVDSFLGVTFNSITGDFGRNGVLEMAPEKEKICRVDSQLEDFRRVSLTDKAQTNKSSHIGGEVDVHAIAGAEFHYAGWSNTLSLDSYDDEVYESRLVTKEACVRDLRPQLTHEFLSIIQQLPRWSIASQEPYREFFSMHGTHVILRMAMGGHVRVVVHDRRDIRNTGRQRGGGVTASAPGLEAVGVTAKASGAVSRDADSEHASTRVHFTINRCGGAAMAAELSNVLGAHFASVKNRVDSCPWPQGEVRTRWMEALKDDPEFLKDHRTTEYKPLWVLSGLSARQKEDLKAAFEYLYSKSHPQPPEHSSSPPPPYPEHSCPKEAEMPRKKNKRSIGRAIKDFFSTPFKRSKESK